MYKVGDRVRVVAVKLSPVTEKHREFYEKFLGMEGTIVFDHSRVPAGQDYTSLFSKYYEQSGYSYPYEVKLDGADVQSFKGVEIERI